MTAVAESNSRRNARWKVRLEKCSRKMENLIIRILLSFFAIGSSVRGWEDGGGDDAVNVISVENMDALLGLRMVTELKSFEGAKANETGIGSGLLRNDGGNETVTEPETETETETTWYNGGNETEAETEAARYKRTIDPEATSSGIVDLCATANCRCEPIGNGNINVSCDFQKEEVNLKPGSIPPRTHEVCLKNAEQLRILPGSFSNHEKIQKVTLRNIKRLSIFSLAFQNLSNVFLNLSIEDCERINLEEHSFRNLQHPVTVTIDNCDRVRLKKSIFYWFRKIVVKNVADLELVENTFSSDARKDVESVEATIVFRNVTLNEIPNATFPLNSAKISFYNCTVANIKGGAFSGIALVAVTFRHVKVKRLQGGAFSERTLLQNVEFDNVDIQSVDSNALSAAARLTIQNCRVEEITGGAFNVNTAYLKLRNNHFRKIRRYAFEIHNWNSITIVGNRFQNLEPEFFSAPFSKIASVTTEFTFSNNSLANVEIGVLSFVPDEPGLEVSIRGNIFESVCHCHLEAWIRERAGVAWENFYETSFCEISELLKKCYNITGDYMMMKEYAEEICSRENVAVCEDVGKTYNPNNLVPLDLQNAERTVLGVIFLGILSSIAIMITILVSIWIKEKGMCGKKRKSQGSESDFLSEFCSRMCNKRNLVTTDSISRINIHEYAEIQNRLNQRQKHAILTIEEDAEEDAEEEEEEEDDDEGVVVAASWENKGTQTIPEELTQELIESLREKLDDPENYTEARDMIEHLYDLIKAEEKCNSNSDGLTESFAEIEEDEEVSGIYEMVRSAKVPGNKCKGNKGRKRDVRTTGTNAPCPDELSPVSLNAIRRQPTMADDYFEPRDRKDRKSNEYCEIHPANLTMPDVLASSRITDNRPLPGAPVYAEPPKRNMGPRPLPEKPADPGTSGF